MARSSTSSAIRPFKTPRDRALNGCIEAALRARGRSLSIHDYSRETGVSARMLIHYFGTKAKLDGAVIREIDNAMRLQAERLAQTLGGPGAAEELVRGFRSPASAQVRLLFRTLLARAFAGDATAVAALLEERKRWIDTFQRASRNKRDATSTVAQLLGAALDAILDDISADSTRRPRGRRPHR
jgi:AcrR family transcriptional regulator